MTLIGVIKFPFRGFLVASEHGGQVVAIGVAVADKKDITSIRIHEQVGGRINNPPCFERCICYHSNVGSCNGGPLWTRYENAEVSVIGDF